MNLQGYGLEEEKRSWTTKTRRYSCCISKILLYFPLLGMNNSFAWTTLRPSSTAHTQRTAWRYRCEFWSKWKSGRKERENRSSLTSGHTNQHQEDDHIRYSVVGKLYSFWYIQLTSAYLWSLNECPEFARLWRGIKSKMNSIRVNRTKVDQIIWL